MNELLIISNHLAVKETIGFAIFDKIPIEDHPAVIQFARICWNYIKMSKEKAGLSPARFHSVKLLIIT